MKKKTNYTYKYYKHLWSLAANICSGQGILKTSWKRLEEVFNVTFFFSSKTYWRRLQVVFETCFRDVFLKKSSRHLEDVFKKKSWKHVLKTSLRSLGRRLANTSWRSLERFSIVTLKLSSRRLQGVLENKNFCWAGSFASASQNVNKE